MDRIIKVELNEGSIQNAIDYLKQYKQDLLKKAERFTEALAKEGITVAKMNGGMWGQYIMYSTKHETAGYQSITMMIAQNTQEVLVEWDTGSSTMNPLLMAEFGSGWEADDAKASKYGLSGVAGQGTHPEGRTNKNGIKNAFNPNGWSWKVGGVTYHSYGDKPTAPLEHAIVQMYTRIKSLVIEIFGG